jgi:hypothetical protein
VASTAAAAPRSQTASVSSHHTPACSGAGWLDHWLNTRKAWICVISTRKVVLATGTGRTLSDTSQRAPSTPMEPASSRDTS